MEDLGGQKGEEWSNFRNILLDRLDKLEKLKAPQKEIDELNRQLYGGECPKCKKEYMCRETFSEIDKNSSKIIQVNTAH